MNSNKTSFKVYYKEEIHRVSIGSCNPSFAQLVDTIKSILHSSQLDATAPIKVQYIDEDNDRITVSTQQEWLEAMSALASVQVKKIYVSQEAQQKKKISRHICVSVSAANPEKVDSLNELVERIIEKGEEALTSDQPVNVTLRHRLHVLSLAFIKKGEYDKASNVLKASLKLNPNSKVDLYNLACTYALMGKRDEACVVLKQAVEKGYRDVQAMMVDADLESLREMPEYLAIVEALKPQSAQRVIRRFPMRSVKSSLLDPRRFSAAKKQEEEPIKQEEQKENPPQEEKKQEEEQPVQGSEPEKEPEVAVQEEDKEKEKEDRYGDEMKQLLEMGFTDEGLISALLVVESGDVAKVASLLLGMMD